MKAIENSGSTMSSPKTTKDDSSITNSSKSNSKSSTSSDKVQKPEATVEYKDHYSIGVLVKILDQQQIMSNLVQNYAEFGVEAI